MVTALIALLAFVVIGILVTLVLCAVIVRETLQKQADVLDRAHERWVKHTEGLHDRLMAKDWQQYVEIKSFEDSDEGGFILPEDQEEEAEPALRVPRLSLRMSPDEERLLAEDFTDEGEPIGKVSQ